MARGTHFITAMRDGIADGMRQDDTVVLWGEDADRSVMGSTKGLVEEFGRERVRNMPLSEATMVGAAIGAAASGLRPIVDLMVSSFFYITMDQLANQAAKLRYMSGGQVTLPIVYFAATGGSGSAAAQHSESPHAMFANLGGVKVVLPSSPADARGLMLSAIRDPNPVVYLQEARLGGVRGEVPAEPTPVPLGVATVVREGTDVTLVAFGAAVQAAVQIAVRLEKEGVASVEVIDPRTVHPLDRDTIVASVRKTGRLVVADSARMTCGTAGEVIASVTTAAFPALRAAPMRVTPPDVPMPFSPELERHVIVQPEQVEAAVRTVLAPVPA